MKEHRDLLERAGDGFAFPDHAFERLVRRRDRKRRNQRIAAAVVAVAVLVVPIWMVTSDTPERSTTPGRTGSVTTPEFPGFIGIAGLPPAEAIPSSPSEGELVVGAFFGQMDDDPRELGLNVYEDGRVIWLKSDGARDAWDWRATGWVEQRLTAKGVELIRSEVLSLGLFDHDRYLVGGDPSYYGTIDMRIGDRIVRVSWGDSEEFGSESVVTPEQADALRVLDTLLQDLASWLPASAWEDSELRPYVAPWYSVCYDAEEESGLDRVLSSFPPQVEDLLRPLDRTHDEYGVDDGYHPGNSWCSTVTTEQARVIGEALDAAGITSSGGDAFGRVVYAMSGPDPVWMSMSFDPLLPDRSR